MQSIKVIPINPLVGKVSRADFELFKSAVSYQKTYWVETPAGKKPSYYDKPYIVKFDRYRGEVFIYLNHLPRIKDSLGDGVFLDFCKPGLVIPFQEPKLTGGKELRDYQLDALERMKEGGIVLSATGTGKTIIICGLVSMLPKKKFLVLTHSVDILNGLHSSLSTYSGVRTVLGDSRNSHPSGLPKDAFSYVVTHQSMVKRLDHFGKDYFDGIIVDEAHHVSSPTSNYAKILSHFETPLRWGFTATEPTDWERIFTMEAFIGEVVFDFGINQALEKGVLAKPKIKIVSSLLDPRVKSNFNYKDVIKKAIVVNTSRNRQIVRLMEEEQKKGKSVLILINHIEHGDNLMREARDMGLPLVFVQGSTEKKTREEVRKNLEEKKTRGVIVTTVWYEGVDIPTLDVVINAGGGKSEIRTLQSIGRATRRAEGKEEFLVIDFFDRWNNYLVAHFGERLCLYMDNGWI